jgi:hypothetical protein
MGIILNQETLKWETLCTAYMGTSAGLQKINAKSGKILKWDSTVYNYKFYVVLVNGPNIQYTTYIICTHM